MKAIKFFVLGFLFLMIPCAHADSLFFEDEPIQDGLPVFEMSKTFAEVYQKLDGVKWAGKNINVAIENLENMNSRAHIAATDERVVLVWRDTIVGNYPRPKQNDWNGFGEITAALVLKFRENDPEFRKLSLSETYQTVVDALMRGIDENGRYIYSVDAEIADDGRILTSVGMTGTRDARGNWRVDGVFKGGSADLAGVHSGDLIVKINGRECAKMSDEELNSVMTGFNSGTLKIKLASPFGTRDVVLRRATVVLADADIIHRNVNDAGVILEIIVHNVSDNAVAIIGEAISRYPEIAGIILDMRAAFGDNEQAAARLAGLFVGNVPVMRIVETAQEEIEILPSGQAMTDAPMVVLLSNQTKGTAEAICATLYENARGVLVGTPTAGQARIATRVGLDNGGALELLNKSIKTGSGVDIDGRGVFPIVCLSNIRSSQQQEVFFLNVVNNEFNSRDFNKEPQTDVNAIRRGCPVITSGADEDALAEAVGAKILTDKKVYNSLISQE